LGDAQRTRRVVRRWRIGGSYTFLMARRRAKASFKRADALLRQDALPDAATRWLYQFEFLDWPASTTCGTRRSSA
jgi:hypothetical protein